MPSSQPVPRSVAVLHTLRATQLFAGLAPDDLETIASLAVVRSLAKDEYLFHEGAPCHGFYIVHAGSINVHRVNAAGKEQVIHIFRAGESFAEAALATESGYPADARAAEAAQVLLVQKAGFLALLRRRPELGLRMLASMSLHLRVLVGQLEDLTLKDVETRLANWLLKRCPDRAAERPATVGLGMTKRLLAAELGTVSETLSRSLAKLRDQDLIAVKRDAIIVPSPAALAALMRRNLGE